jgi:hypothetical protein
MSRVLGRLCEKKRTLVAFEHLYAFLAPQSAQIVHATRGENNERKKIKNFLGRSSAAAAESGWRTQKATGKKKYLLFRRAFSAPECLPTSAAAHKRGYSAPCFGTSLSKGHK